MYIDEKISRAKAKLLVDYPFFGSLASRLELKQNDDIQAFSNDGITLEYNSDFIADSSIAELEFVFANGAMHASMAYEQRQNNRSGWLWQLATDYAINDMLVQNDLERPYQAHYSERFNGLYAEEIYADLQVDILRDAQEFEDYQNVSDVNENENLSSPEIQDTPQSTSSQITLDEQLFASFSQSILDAELKTDSLPTTLERFFSITPSSKLDWREELYNAINRFAKDDYTQMPPNKKFLSQGIYLPSSISETFSLVVAIDSSGSVDAKLLELFLSELNSMMLSIAKYSIDVLVCDDKITQHHQFVSGENLDIEIKDGGATDFSPVFKFIEEELFDVKMLLYFSDLDGIFPSEIPHYEVKWISQNLVEIPFGEIIQI